jgi:hypothetical protein
LEILLYEPEVHQLENIAPVRSGAIPDLFPTREYRSDRGFWVGSEHPSEKPTKLEFRSTIGGIMDVDQDMSIPDPTWAGIRKGEASVGDLSPRTYRSAVVLVVILRLYSCDFGEEKAFEIVTRKWPA